MFGAAHTLPARNLRPGDRFPRQGVEVTVAQPPLISQDGATVAVVLEVPGTGYRLARLPADDPVEMVRAPKVERSYVRRDRVARSTGTRILVLDLTHPDSEIAPRGVDRWATLCTVHHTLAWFRGVSTAEGHAIHPEHWCADCAALYTAAALRRVGGPRIGACSARDNAAAM